jgi:protease IV
MSMSPDQIIDRRRLRRKLTFWRVFAFLVLAAFIFAVAAVMDVFEPLTKKGADHIARVEISGFISNDRDMLDLLEDLGKKQHVKAVLLDISSPGGSTVGGEAVYEAVRNLSKKKPVVTTVGTLAASAGYMIACATDHIVARRSSIVGSIGVLIQYGNVAGLFEKLGIEMDAVKSSPLKAEPSPFNPASEEAKQMLAKVVGDSYEWFVGLVAERRSFSPQKARQLADGAIFTGSQGLENGLVDQIGDEESARKWLVDNKGISDDLEFVDWKPKRQGSSDLLSIKAAAALSKLLGIEIDTQTAAQLREFLPRPLFLDGLISVMQTQ